ncbi:MAG: GNAT family N-acetyltransferase [Povalibacter sp.]|jgi:predicted N-acetyltransferase YhbS
MTNESSPTIRQAQASDASSLAVLGAATFTETFGHLYPPEDLQTFLVESHSVDAWSARLADPQRAVWVAELDGTMMGFICVGPCKLPIENLEATAGEIQQLYVLSRHHNLRLGTGLMKAGLEWLEAQDRSPLYIGVWSENLGAHRFYARYGFSKVGEYGFPVGKTVDHEWILKR